MSQPEARLQRRIQSALRARGAFVFKVHGSTHMMSGLPDLIVCWRGQFIGMEVKMPGNGPSEVQKLRAREIRAADGFCFLVYSDEDALKALKVVEKSIDPPESPDHT